MRPDSDEATSEGPVVMPLALAAERHPDIVERHLGSVVTARTRLTAENDAHWTDGALVYVPRGVHVEAPIVLTTVHEAAGSALHHRTLVVLEEGAQAEVWHQALSADADGEGVVNGVVELIVGPNANLRFVDAQALSERTLVFGAQRAVVEQDGSLDWITLGFGSANGKVFLETKLAGRGATGKVTGAYATRGRQHLDFDTLQEHAAPDTTSDLAFRGILGDRSSTVWRGMIKVDRGAQRTDAFQESRNLLLTKRAHADSIPGLEILANDVRCTHAAAIAQIDRDQLFYLRAHGLPEPPAQARRRGLPRGDRRALRGGRGARRRRRRDRAPAGDRSGLNQAQANAHADNLAAPIRLVMKSAQRRSDGVNTTLSVPLPGRSIEGRLDFDRLYRTSRDDLYAYVATMLRDRAAAEDVTAVAFERAMRKQRSYRSSRGSERAWLFGIARNAALDEIRRRGRTTQLASEPLDDGMPVAADEAERSIDRATVRAALESLPPREREVIALKFHAGLSNAELARVLAVSESNAGTLLHRAMQQLRKACHETA